LIVGNSALGIEQRELFMRILLALLAWSLASIATACSLCTSTINRATFGEEMDNAAVVVVGRLSNPQLNPNPAGVGAGTTDLTIDKVLKADSSFKAGRMMTLSRYMPVDPKQPPQFLIFFDRFRDKLEPLQGVAVKSPALLNYLEQAGAARAKGRAAALVYYAKYLDHADDAVALDAFMEFAKSKDADVGKAAQLLDPAMVRRLLAKKNLDSDKLSLYAFLLGSCGQDRDADELLRIAGELTGERKIALDGVLAGYLTLRPQEGWQRLAAILSDKRQPFSTRFAALRAVRMLQGCKGADIRPNALAVYRHVIRDGEMADLAVEDLRRWQWWELTADIAAQFGQESHRAPIVQHCLIRYALSCPLPEAKQLLARARQLEPDYVDDQEKLIPLPNRR
jgi:hypothetical protein